MLWHEQPLELLLPLQVQAWEEAAYPGVTEEAPATTREFLEMRSPALPMTDSAEGAEAMTTGSRTAGLGAQGSSGGGGGGDPSGDGDNCGERLVVYPARNGHASYHAPRRYVGGVCAVRKVVSTCTRRLPP